jgi:hypothetical protein
MRAPSVSTIKQMIDVPEIPSEGLRSSSDLGMIPSPAKTRQVGGEEQASPKSSKIF